MAHRLWESILAKIGETKPAKLFPSSICDSHCINVVEIDLVAPSVPQSKFFRFYAIFLHLKENLKK